MSLLAWLLIVSAGLHLAGIFALTHALDSRDAAEQRATVAIERMHEYRAAAEAAAGIVRDTLACKGRLARTGEEAR